MTPSDSGQNVVIANANRRDGKWGRAMCHFRATLRTSGTVDNPRTHQVTAIALSMRAKWPLLAPPSANVMAHLLSRISIALWSKGRKVGLSRLYEQWQPEHVRRRHRKQKRAIRLQLPPSSNLVESEYKAAAAAYSILCLMSCQCGLSHLRQGAGPRSVRHKRRLVR